MWTLFIIFLPIHNYVSLCVGLSHKIPIKYIFVCGCNLTKCGKLLQGTVVDDVHSLLSQRGPHPYTLKKSEWEDCILVAMKISIFQIHR